MNPMEPYPIEKIENAKKKKSEFRKVFCKWFYDLSTEDKIKAISINSANLAYNIKEMKDKYDQNIKYLFRFTKHTEVPSLDQFRFTTRIENETDVKNERKYTERMFFDSLRFLSLENDCDTVTFFPAFLEKRDDFEYIMLYFSDNRFLEEECL